MSVGHSRAEQWQVGDDSEDVCSLLATLPQINVMEAKHKSYFKPRTLTRGSAREDGVRNPVNADRQPKQQRRALDRRWHAI
jgi:hypothetical protein